MIVGVPKETFPGERRVSLVPVVLPTLAKASLDVLVELGSVYFEADREVDEASGRSAADLFDEALELNPICEGALLGLFELHRVNWRRTSKPAAYWLNEALAARPDSVAALLAGLSADLDDGRLRAARGNAGRGGRLIEGRAKTVVDDKPANGLRRGVRVFHQKFGYGKVIAVDGHKLEVAFEKAGTKKVMASFVEKA